ncbi:MAG: TonB-dependent receptor [Paludibacter sp.]|nr:TonB-dependent receptor [Paludibacter sp.]
MKKWLQRIVITQLLMLLSIYLVNAQEISLSGKVVSSEGEAMPGVTVVVKGTSIGSVTDINGTFSIKVSSGAKFLVFSFVGMKTKEVQVTSSSVYNVTLEQEAFVLDEVVAIGYGTTLRRDLTGSVSSMSSTKLKDLPVNSLSQALTGQMAGVQVTKTEGAPDAEIKIRIRGGGSITQDNSPLYIVDGFPVNGIDNIAPNDVASIDVLKDASSTAIYGARGANGVVLITTKGGFEGKAKVSYNAYVGAKMITKTLDVLDPYEYVLWQYELQVANLGTEKYYGDFRDFELYKQMDGTDWQDVIFGRTGSSIYNNLSVSGGSKTSTFNLSLTRNKEEEIMIGSGSARSTLAAKLMNKVKPWLTIDFNARLSDVKMKGAGTSNNSRLSHAVQFRPINGIMDFVDSDIAAIADYETASFIILNPLKQTNDDYRRTQFLTFNFNGAATIKFSKNLEYRLSYGTQYETSGYDVFYGINTSNVRSYGEQPLATVSKVDAYSYRLSNVLTYTKKNFLDGHNMSAMMGEELNHYESKSVASSAKYFPKYIDPVSAISMMNLGTPDPIVTSDNTVRTSSVFGRVNYDYLGKYLLSATIRADGSSKFARGYQWGYFPSAALAWRISDEKFMSTMNLWLNNLKLRVSYGESGNNRISNDAWQKTFSVRTQMLYMDETATVFLEPNNVLSNPKIKWETTQTRNIGLDFGLFKQRLSGSLEIYKNTTKDLLIAATIPASSGYSIQWQNIGQTTNRGLEIELNGVLVEKNDFRLSASFNIGFNRNRIDKLGETKMWEQISGWNVGGEAATGDYLIEEGGKVGLMYGYETEGMYNFSDFTFGEGKYTLNDGVSDNSNVVGTGTSRFLPGALKLKDQNGDFVVDAANDKVVIGDANPDHTGGFSINSQYKGFDFSAFFNWVYGNDIYNANKLAFTSFQNGWQYKNILSIMDSEHRFSYINKETGKQVVDPVELEEMNKNATLWSPTNQRTPLHSWAVEDGSFLRLNNLTLGYSLPNQFLKKLSIEQLRLYLTAYNLYTWTNYSGYDPEVDTQRSTPLTPGVDWCAYPRSRSFIFGLNLTF